MTAILDAIYETRWEFQAGPRQTRRRQVKRGRPKLKQPKWMELRARRLPIKKEKFSQIKQEKKLIPKREKPRLKRDVTKLRRPLPKVEPKKLLEIKRERAIFNTAEPEEEKDPGTPDKPVKGDWDLMSPQLWKELDVPTPSKVKELNKTSAT